VTRYTADSTDRVRDAVDMIALVSARTDLRRRGVDSYFGICPFHEERTASFHVRPDEKHYHCFGCQVSGDPFTFVMETEGLDFKAALESLAQRFGVRLQTEDEDPAAASRRERRERLYTVLDRAAQYYARFLWRSDEAAPAREYLRGRGLSEQTLHEFRVGFASRAWDRMAVASRSAGFTDEELVAAGLAQPSRRNPAELIDRFRGRIMFPSADPRGRVRGFGARAMSADQQPKYLNTSENEVYSKRWQLFGIDRARLAASRAGRMILVEGYTDVLALHQAGLQNAVGIMGTSLTEEQVSELERIVPVLQLCLDADRAGQDAMLRAARLTAARNPPLELRVVPLPAGTDPAELVERQGVEELRRLVDASVPFVVFNVERILERSNLDSAEGRDQALTELRPVLAGLPASILHTDLTRRVAGRLDLTGGQLAGLLAGGPTGPSPPDQTRVSADRPIEVTNPAIRAERTFLAFCIALPDAGQRALAAIDPAEHITSERYRRAARHLAGQTEMPLTGIAADDDELARVLADLVARAGKSGRVTEQHLEGQRLLLERARLDRAIRRARAEGGGDIPGLARDRQEVQEAIRRVDMRMESPV
jgi:DNA primase